MLNPLIGILELIIHLDLLIVKNKIKYHLKIFLINFDLRFKIQSYKATLMKNYSPANHIIYLFYTFHSKTMKLNLIVQAIPYPKGNNIDSATTTPEILSFN